MSDLARISVEEWSHMERGGLPLMHSHSSADKLSLQQSVDSDQLEDYFWKEKVYSSTSTVRLKTSCHLFPWLD